MVFSFFILLSMIALSLNLSKWEKVPDKTPMLDVKTLFEFQLEKI